MVYLVYLDTGCLVKLYYPKPEGWMELFILKATAKPVK